MTKLNISRAAKAVGKNRKTIQNHIKKGKISYEIDSDGNKVIDISELQRAYGELKEATQPYSVSKSAKNGQQYAPEITQLLQQQISDLKQEVKEARQEKEQDREEYKRREERLYHLLEDKREAHQPQNMISPKALWAFISICVVITAIPFVAWFLLDFLKQ